MESRREDDALGAALFLDGERASAIARAVVGADDALLWEALAAGAELPTSDGVGAFGRCALALAALESGDGAAAAGWVRSAAEESSPSRLAEHVARVITLARVRRVNGRPHLAARLLNSVARVAGPGWDAWLGWELLAAGSAAAPRGALAQAAVELIEATREGDAEMTRRAATRLRELCVAFAPVAREVRALVASLDPSPGADVEPEGRAFREGSSARLGGGLEAIANTPGTPLAVVLVNESGARRVLEPARSALPSLHNVGSWERPGRTETGLVVLAFAGSEGLEPSAFFESAYGFRFRKSLHDGVLRVLLTRMRQAMGDAGDVVRDDGALRLTASKNLCIPDPRVRTVAESAVLQSLTEGRGVSARDLAAAVNLPLRTVQAELGRLVEEGVCVRRSVGRSTDYVVEDTALADPTRFLQGGA